MRCCAYIFSVALFFLLTVSFAVGQSEFAISPFDTGLSVAESPWGRFPLKSWCRLQTTTTAMQGDKPLSAVRETLITLQSIEKDVITLKEITTIDVGGKRVENPPTVKSVDFYQENILQGTLIKTGKPEKRMIGNKMIPCEVRHYEQTLSSSKRTTTIWFSRQVYPYVLRVHSVLRTIPTEKEREEKIIEQSLTEVTETAAFSFLRRKHGVYHLKTTVSSGEVNTIIETDGSILVPGGIIRKTTTETDKNGNVIRSSETRLINFSS
jgi:hypothetical protein